MHLRKDGNHIWAIVDLDDASRGRRIWLFKATENSYRAIVVDIDVEHIGVSDVNNEKLLVVLLASD